jgi:dipeptidase E
MNALDGHDETRRAADSRTQIANLNSIGLNAEDLDLRTMNPTTVRQSFGDPDFVWVSGGNVFTLRMAMARSGIDQILIERITQDRLVYAGYSAGPCVLAPSLAGLERCDPIEPCVATYGGVRFDGLGILDRPFVPHLNSPSHPESAALGEVATAYEAAGQPYWALSDGQALVVQDARVTLT